MRMMCTRTRLEIGQVLLVSLAGLLAFHAVCVAMDWNSIWSRIGAQEDPWRAVETIYFFVFSAWCVVWASSCETKLMLLEAIKTKEQE